MKAAVYRGFEAPITIERVVEPKLLKTGVIIKVKATGVCRSDWHGWMGHDPDISLPHVPGHELAGEIVEVGQDVNKWRAGDRVTVPFVCGCGMCEQCLQGNQQVCDHQFQPGFTHWGSFAELVAINHADVNLVRLPNDVDFVSAASLGCRFITAFRALVDQGQLRGGQWVAIHGCGGVGLSATMIASALGALVIAIDIDQDKLDLAGSLGAVATINGSEQKRVVESVLELTGGGAHISVDALGSAQTCFNSIAGLRKRGKHIQVGLMVGSEAHAAIPFDKVVSRELEVIGSHGMQAYRIPSILELVNRKQLDPGRLVQRRIGLDQAPQALVDMGRFSGLGITVIDKF